jgi:lauroyl/myristoyl acyltransferase
MLVPRIPLVIARPLFALIGALTWVFAGETRRRAERNLRHIPALAADAARLQAAVRAVFVTSALNYLDFLRGRHLSEQEITSGWTVEHEDLFDEALAEGRGVVLMSAHFGNMEVAASRVAYRLDSRYPIIVPAERMRPERLFDLFCALRNHHNMRVVPGDARDSLREMAETVKAGGILLIVGDRHILGGGVQVDFFDEPSTFATAPMALALRTGAPIICAFSWRTGPGTAYGVYYRLTWDEARDAGPQAASAPAGRPRGNRAEQTLPALRAYVRLLERVISAHPEAWVSALAPVWEASTDTSATGAAPAPDQRPTATPTGVPLSGGTSRRGVNFAETPSVESATGDLT